jgi:uncharacterized protein (TIGR03437 family)
MMLRACWRLAVAVVFLGAALGQSTGGAAFGPLLLSSNPFSGSTNVSQILSYDPLSGGFLGVFAAGASLSQAQGIAYGPDGNLYVASGSKGKILKFDGKTGAALPDFASVTEPLGLAFGPDKNLYVVTNQPDGVRKFSGIDGHSMGAATGIPEGALKGAFAIAFGPDGNLYVTGTLSGTVVRINSSTLAFMPPVFATLPASGAGGLLFVPNPQTGVTDLLVSDLFHGAIYRLDSNTGQIIGTFASGGALADPGAMALGPNNQVYVSNPFVPNILRYDAATGDLVDIFISPSPYGPGSVNFLTFAPPLTPPTISSNGIVNGIVNAASYVGGTVAPGELLTLFGSGMGPATATPLQIDSKTGRISAYTAGTRVLFNGTPAPVIYAQQYQVSVAVPYSVAGLARVQVQVEYLGQLSQPVTVNVSDAMPGIFTAAANGRGQGAIINADGLTPNSASAPAARGRAVSIYATGGGQTNPAGVDGQLTPNISPLPVLPVSVSIGGIPAKVQYAGGSPGEILGLLQINAVVPPNAPTGDEVPVYVSVGNATSQPGVTMSIR